MSKKSSLNIGVAGVEAAVSPPPTPAERGTMETASCIVRLAGDVRNEVPMRAITPAAIVLLRHIHGGPDTVYSVKKDGKTNITAMREKRRLIAVYPRYEEAIEMLFPGLKPDLPTTVAEVEQLAASQMSDEEEVDAAEDLLAS